MEREGESGARIEGSGVGGASTSNSIHSVSSYSYNSSSLHSGNYVSIRDAGSDRKTFKDGNSGNSLSTRRYLGAGASSPRYGATTPAADSGGGPGQHISTGYAATSEVDVVKRRSLGSIGRREDVQECHFDSIRAQPS